MSSDSQIVQTDLVTIRQAATLLGVDLETLQKWQNEELLHPLQEQGEIYFSIKEIVALQKQNWLAEQTTLAGQVYPSVEELVQEKEKNQEDLHTTHSQEELLKRYQLLSEHARDIILFVRPNGSLLEANNTAVQTYGYSRDELLGKTIYDLRANNTLGSIGEEMSQADHLGLLFETLHRRKDGSVFPVEVSSQSTEIGGERVLLSIIRDITQRKRAEAALRESEARFHTMADSAPVLLWLAGTDGLATYFNKPWLDFTGRTLEQELGEGWTSGVHSDDVQRCLDIYYSAFKTWQPFRMDYRLRRYDGEYRWVQDTGTPMFSLDGSFTGYIGSCIDITERRRNEEALRFLAEASVLLTSSLDYLTILQMVAKLAIPFLADACSVDLIEEDGSLRRAAAAHIDPTKVELMYRVAREYPPAPAQLQAMLPDLQKGKSRLVPELSEEMLAATSYDENHLRLMQEIGPHRSTMVVPLVARGRAIGTIRFSTTTSNRRYSTQDLILAEDLTRRVALAVDNALLYQEAQASAQEQALARQEVEQLANLLAQRAGELDAIFEALPDGVYVCDTHNRLLRVNSRGSELLGMQPEQMLQPNTEINRISQIRSLAGTPLTVDEMPLALALKGETGSNFRMTIRPYGTEQDIQLRASYAPIRNERGEIIGAVAIASDITELYRLERQKDEFLGIASHELKTPITAIKGLAQLAIRRLERNGQTQEIGTLRTLDKQINRLTALIDSLLNVSRIQTGRMDFQFVRFDFAELVRQSVEAIQATSEYHIIQLEAPDTLELVGDSHQLDQVLTNLLSNAIKYSPGGGLIEVSLKPEENEAILCVRDYGIGVPVQDRALLFERFQRASNVGDFRISGFGVGLYISNEIVMRHQGRIWLADLPEPSEPGSLFCLALPLNLAETPPKSE